MIVEDLEELLKYATKEIARAFQCEVVVLLRDGQEGRRS